MSRMVIIECGYHFRKQLALDEEAEKVIRNMAQLHRNLNEKWTKVNCSVAEWKAKIDTLLPVRDSCILTFFPQIY